jgi:hypothetical protein
MIVVPSIGLVLYCFHQLISQHFSGECLGSFLAGTKILKVLWQDATLFVYFSYFNIFYSIHTFIHSITFIQYNTIQSIAIRRGLSPFLHCFLAQWEKPPCGAEPRIELGPALQQADALPTEPSRTIKNEDWSEKIWYS